MESSQLSFRSEKKAYVNDNLFQTHDVESKQIKNLLRTASGWLLTEAPDT